MRFVLTLAAAAALLVACGGSDSNDGDNQGPNPGNPGNVQGIINASNYVGVVPCPPMAGSRCISTAFTALTATISPRLRSKPSPAPCAKRLSLTRGWQAFCPQPKGRCDAGCFGRL